MLRTPIIAICMLCMCTTAFAQKSDKKESNTKPPSKFYIGTSTGFNNQSGILGLNLELPVAYNVSIGTGIGTSTWGGKTYLEARYYFQPGFKGWAIGAGITHSSGLDEFKTKLPTLNNGGNNEDVTLHLQQKTNMFVAGYRMWKLGRNHNRFYVQAGYSVSLSATKYTVTSGEILTKDGDRTVKVISPGGLIAVVGFSFAL